VNAYFILRNHFYYIYFFFLYTDAAGNYDVVNNVVIPTPGPPDPRAQNSLRQSWEMNYQEAAIYLQVIF